MALINSIGNNNSLSHKYVVHRDFDGINTANNNIENPPPGNCVVYSALLQHLVNVYRNNISVKERRQLTIAPLRGRLDQKTATVISETGEGMVNLAELPSSLQLLIFSYLDVKSLCQVSKTCQQLHSLSSDHLLWRQNLTRDIQNSIVINYQTHPQIYLDAHSDLSMKEIYSRCCSKLHQNKNITTDNSLTARFLKFARPFFYHSPPTRLVMFGPGLESQTSTLVYQFLWGEMSPFQVEGMFPGQQDGVGSGVSLKYNEEMINLITLYSSTKKEREANNGTVKNKILLETENEGTRVSEVTHPVRQLCKTVGGFIYVVDSSVNKEKVCEASNVLTSMMDERWTTQKAPLLVFSCSVTADQPHLTCADITEALQLYNMNRPWQVNRVLVENLEGVQSGINWLLNKC